MVIKEYSENQKDRGQVGIELMADNVGNVYTLVTVYIITACIMIVTLLY